MITRCICMLAAATAALNAVPAQAQSAPAPAAGQERSATALPVLIGDQELQETRGGTTIIINHQTLSAVNSGNVLGDYVAGDVSLSDDALANFAGIGNFTINTGAQNNLQTGMILTVNIGE